MKINRAHKIRLYLDKEQANYLASSAGVARFAFNWGLYTWQKQYNDFKLGSLPKAPNVNDLRKLFNQTKHLIPTSDWLAKANDPDYKFSLDEKYQFFPFVNDVSKYCTQQALINLGHSFDRFFKRKSAYPTFKKFGVGDSFYLGNDVVKIISKSKLNSNNNIKLNLNTNKKSNHKPRNPGKIQEFEYYLKVPNLKKPILLAEKPRFVGKINSYTFTKKAGNWYVSISYELDLPVKQEDQRPICGIDLGSSVLATIADSNGNIHSVANPKAYRKYQKQLKLYQRRQAKKVLNSKNKAKAKLKIAKLHEKITNLRDDILHEITTNITKSYKQVVIEDLNVKGMLKNHKLAKSIADASFGKVRQMLEYKAELTGTEIIVADRYYPSSKECSECHVVNKELQLSQKTWTCVCGATHERDENAAKNLKNYENSEYYKENKEKLEIKANNKKAKTITMKSYKKKIKEPVAVGGLSMEEESSVIGSCEPLTTVSDEVEIKQNKKCSKLQ